MASSIPQNVPVYSGADEDTEDEYAPLTGGVPAPAKEAPFQDAPDALVASFTEEVFGSPIESCAALKDKLSGACENEMLRKHCPVTCELCLEGTDRFLARRGEHGRVLGAKCSM